MELIIFLVLGTFFLLKVASKKGQDQEQDRLLKAKTDSRKKRMDEWLRRVTDQKLENELEEKIYNGLAQTAFENAAKGLSDSDINALRYDKTMVLRLLMADRGKLIYEDALFGISVFAHGPTEIRRIEDAKMKRRIIYHIQDKLKAHGVDEQIKCEPSVEGGNSLTNGKYTWAPMWWE